MENPKILIVDDDTELLNSLSLRLRNEGFDVTVAMDGYQGLEQARTERPNLLILDINLPSGDGLSIQERLQATNGPWPPVIYLTGIKSIHTEIGIKRLGAFAVIYKPFEFSVLLETIKRAIGTSLHAV